MANLFKESFDKSTTMLDEWTANTVYNFASQSITSAAGRHGSNGLRCTTGGAFSGSQPTKYFSNPSVVGDTFINGFSLHNPTTNGATEIAAVMTAAMTTLQCCLFLNPDGSITIKRGATTLATTAPALLSSTNTYYIEWKVKLHASTGTYEIRINGVSVLSATGQNTANSGTTFDSFRLGTQNLNISCTLDYDDVYVNDGSGAVNNDFFGEIRVDVHFPTANGNTSNSTPSTGSNRGTTLDEATPNGDTDYNALTAVNQKDTLTLQDLVPMGAGTIFAFSVYIMAEKTDAGAGIFVPVLRSGGTDYESTQQIAPSAGSYGPYGRQVYDVDPATGVQLTEVGFNALQPGYKRVA